MLVQLYAARGRAQSAQMLTSRKVAELSRPAMTSEERNTLTLALEGSD